MPAGRPRLNFNQKLFEELCKIQCTEIEIASALGMSVDTLERRCQEVYGANFADVYAQKREGGKSSLRRAQWLTAVEAKNPVMQIWLGKQMLGQVDKVEHTGKDGGPLVVLVEGGLNPDVYGPGSSG
jgi:hypothetical protein